MNDLKLTECPRDAMQGLHDFIPTEIKIDYINDILKCGFDTVDFGSFVSPKAIPQMKDTEAVLKGIVKNNSKLLAIVANERGANDAVVFEEIDYLGYPFSVSEEFQLRNTNATIEESFKRVEVIQELCVKNKKELVLYLSMGFGNPYGELWHPDIVASWSEKLYSRLGIVNQSLSDTIGAADDKIVKAVFKNLIENFPEISFGAHLHTLPENAAKLVEAAYSEGCRKFDGAIKGFGGCPMAKDDLTGNMPTELMISWFEQNNIATGIDQFQFESTIAKALTVFP
jgi:hydroxymethylglutaryl-CoA lyase